MAERLDDLSRLRIPRETQGPGAARGRAWGRFWPVAIGLCAIALIWWRPWESAPPLVQPERATSAQGSAAGAPAPAPTGIAANGYVVARRRAALATDMQGRIVELPVAEGDRVEAGALIARLDTQQLEASLQRVLAETATAQATLDYAWRELERSEKLAASRAASEAELDAARTRRDEAQTRLQALEASARELRVQIEKSTIVAPFAGIVVAKQAEVGEVVSAVGAAGPGGGAVATIVDFETLEVQVELAQASLAGVTVGAAARIYLDAFPQEAYTGRVRQIWPTADRQKATVELRVTFERLDQRVLPEMGVRVVFAAPEKP